MNRRDFLRCVSVAAVGAVANRGLSAAAEPKPKRPNVIILMTDDQGCGDFGVVGNPVIQTPNLDAMARRSAEMTRFYVSPVCSPTRASLMTGRHPARLDLTNWIGGEQNGLLNQGVPAPSTAIWRVSPKRWDRESRRCLRRT